jgi:hypothetical protein
MVFKSCSLNAMNIRPTLLWTVHKKAETPTIKILILEWKIEHSSV